MPDKDESAGLTGGPDSDLRLGRDALGIGDIDALPVSAEAPMMKRATHRLADNGAAEAEMGAQVGQ